MRMPRYLVAIAAAAMLIGTCDGTSSPSCTCKE